MKSAEETHHTQSVMRRTFVKTTLTAGTAAIIAPRLAFGAETSTTKKANLACCGIGNRAAEIIREFKKNGAANMVALCDTDMGAPQTQEWEQFFKL